MYRFLKSVGTDKESYRKGRVYKLSPSLAKSFLAAGYIEKVTPEKQVTKRQRATSKTKKETR